VTGDERPYFAKTSRNSSLRTPAGAYLGVPVK
jgi:hypothetical protein